MHRRPYLFLNKYFNPHNEKLILSRFTPSKINFTHRFKSVSILSTFPPPHHKNNVPPTSFIAPLFLYRKYLLGILKNCEH